MTDKPKPSTTSVVIESIKEMITRGELKAGMRLPIENDLAASLGVSRGMLREGIRALAAMGIVETRQGDGTYVTSLEPDQLIAPMAFMVDIQGADGATDLLAVRRALETEAASRAARLVTDEELDAAAAVLDGVDQLMESDDQAAKEKALEADVAFHRIVAKASGNAVLEALIDAISSRTVHARMWRVIVERDSISTAQHEHRLILDELRRRDPDAARARMAVHLLGVEEFIDSKPPTDLPKGD